MYLPKEKDVQTLLVSHNFVALHRLIEIGCIFLQTLKDTKNILY